ncbi:MAG TPA: glycosyltransferase, partial [Rhodoglobus sp.]|nr:glycosyltransferase [Rhodoglobus sp.]
MRVLVAVPALNEAAVIGQVLASLSAVHPLRDVVIIDDGSRDATAQIARRAGARVVSHPINLGVGAAMGTAFKYAVREGYDVILAKDGVDAMR